MGQLLADHRDELRLGQLDPARRPLPGDRGGRRQAVHRQPEGRLRGRRQAVQDQAAALPAQLVRRHRGRRRAVPATGPRPSPTRSWPTAAGCSSATTGSSCTLLLSALAPSVPALAELTIRRLGALNHGSVTRAHPGQPRSASSRTRSPSGRPGSPRSRRPAPTPTRAYGWSCPASTWTPSSPTPRSTTTPATGSRSPSGCCPRNWASSTAQLSDELGFVWRGTDPHRRDRLRQRRRRGRAARPRPDAAGGRPLADRHRPPLRRGRVRARSRTSTACGGCASASRASGPAPSPGCPPICPRSASRTSGVSSSSTRPSPTSTASTPSTPATSTPTTAAAPRACSRRSARRCSSRSRAPSSRRTGWPQKQAADVDARLRRPPRRRCPTCDGLDPVLRAGAARRHPARRGQAARPPVPGAPRPRPRRHRQRRQARRHQEGVRPRPGGRRGARRAGGGPGQPTASSCSGSPGPCGLGQQKEAYFELSRYWADHFRQLASAEGVTGDLVPDHAHRLDGPARPARPARLPRQARRRRLRRDGRPGVGARRHRRSTPRPNCPQIKDHDALRSQPLPAEADWDRHGSGSRRSSAQKAPDAAPRPDGQPVRPPDHRGRPRPPGPRGRTWSQQLEAHAALPRPRRDRRAPAARPRPPLAGTAERAHGGGRARARRGAKKTVEAARLLRPGRGQRRPVRHLGQAGAATVARGRWPPRPGTRWSSPPDWPGGRGPAGVAAQRGPRRPADRATCATPWPAPQREVAALIKRSQAAARPPPPVAPPADGRRPVHLNTRDQRPTHCRTPRSRHPTRAPRSGAVRGRTPAAGGRPRPGPPPSCRRRLAELAAGTPTPPSRSPGGRRMMRHRRPPTPGAVRLNTATVTQYLSSQSPRRLPSPARRGRRRVVLLRSAPQWDGPAEAAWGEGREAGVAVAPSPLAVHELVLGHLDAAGRPAPRSWSSSPTASRTNSTRRSSPASTSSAIEAVDNWDVVREAFGAAASTRGSSDDNWAAEALLDAAPPGGWPPAAPAVCCPATRPSPRSPAPAAARPLRHRRDWHAAPGDDAARHPHPAALVAHARRPRSGCWRLRGPERAGLAALPRRGGPGGPRRAGPARPGRRRARGGRGRVRRWSARRCGGTPTPTPETYRARGRAERWLRRQPPAHGRRPRRPGGRLRHGRRGVRDRAAGSGRTGGDEPTGPRGRRITGTVLDRAAALARQFGAEAAVAASPVLRGRTRRPVHRRRPGPGRRATRQRSREAVSALADHRLWPPTRTRPCPHRAGADGAAARPVARHRPGRRGRHASAAAHRAPHRRDRLGGPGPGAHRGGRRPGPRARRPPTTPARHRVRGTGAGQIDRAFAERWPPGRRTAPTPAACSPSRPSSTAWSSPVAVQGGSGGSCCSSSTG